MSANGEYVVYLGYILSCKEAEKMRNEVEHMFGHSRGKPRAPEKPKNAYFFFCKTNRARLSNEHPGTNPSKMITMLVQNWKSLSDGDKAPYEKMAEDDEKRYADERASYQRRPIPKGRKFDFISDDLIEKYREDNDDCWYIIPDLLSFKREMCSTSCCFPGSVVFGQLVCTTDPEEGTSTSIPLAEFKTKDAIDESLGNFLPFYRAVFGKEPVFGLHCQPSDCCSCT